jgi:hypothetical protein
MHRHDPGRVGVLVVAALLEPDDRLDLAFGVRAGDPGPAAATRPPHQVGHVQLRGEPEAEAGEMRVLGRRDDLAAAARADADAVGAARREGVGDARGAHVAAAVGREHHVVDADVLDRLGRSIRHRDRRALDEALIVVADHREVAVLAGQELEQAVLGVVGVLVLVDEHVAEGGGVAGADLGEELEDVDRAHQQVVEVHGVHAVQVALVEVVDVGDGLLEEGADLLAVGLGVAQLVLGVGDLMLHGRRGEALGVDAELVDAALDQAARVGGVVDRVLTGVAEARSLGAQQARARGVEGHDPHAPRRVAEQELDALAHLLCGLVGEGDGEQLAGTRPPGLHEPGDAVGEHAGLARAGAGQDEQRPFAVRDGVALGRVEALEEGRDSVVGGGFRQDT